jgi:hypothetical protein
MKRKAPALYTATLLTSISLVACGGLDQDISRTEQAVGVTGPAFYVDGELYRTVGTPQTLPPNAPDHSFDTIYALPDQSHNVATAAPGDEGFNGGRWMVHLITFTDYDAALAEHDSNGSGDFDSADEVQAALDAGAAVDQGIVKIFECPVIPQPRNG